MPVQVFYGFFRPRFLLYINDLLEVGINLPHPLTKLGSDDAEAEFDGLFAIGPGGIDVLMKIFDQIYRGIDDTYHLVQGNEKCHNVISDIHSASRSLLFSLQHFRAKHHRSLWDPKGCRELIELFRNGDSKFPVRCRTTIVSLQTLTLMFQIAADDNRMLPHLKLINVYQVSAPSLAFQLRTAFGHESDPRQMYKDILVGGPAGLPFFYEHIVARILDDVEHPDYSTILGVICATSAGVARKVVSHIKVFSRRHECALPSPDVFRPQSGGISSQQHSATPTEDDGAPHVS